MKRRILMAAVAFVVSILSTGILYAASGDLSVNGNATVSGNETVSGSLGVGTTSPAGKAEINGNLKVDGTITNSGETVSGNAAINGTATINQAIITSATITTATISGDLTVNGTLSVGAGGVKYLDGSVQTSAKSLVWDYLVIAATTSVTSPVLNGLADGGYEFEFWIVCPQAVVLRQYYNNDLINSNYWTTSMYDYSGSAVGNQSFSDSQTASSSGPGIMRVTGSIGISPNGYIQTHFTSSDNYQAMQVRGIQYNKNAFTNLTRLDIVSNIANGIGVNSRFRLWKLNR